MLHELRNPGIGGPQHDVLRRAGLHDAALVHDRDPVADAQRLVEVVADEQDGLAHPLLQ